MAEVDWKMEAVMQYLKSPAYTYPVMNFIDDNCAVFDQEDESKHEFNAIHQKFVELVFGLLEAFLQEIGVSSEEFAAACDTAVKAGGDRAFVFQQIMAVDDFPTFRRMMMKRNLEIEMEALKQMETLQQKGASKEAPAAPTEESTGEGDDDLGEFGQLSDLDLEEQRQLEEALALSRMTFDDVEQAANNDDDDELQLAIAMSKAAAEQETASRSKLQDFVPEDKTSEEEMIAAAMAESLKQPPPTQTEEREPAVIPQTVIAAPPPEELEAMQAAAPVLKSEVVEAKRQLELAVAEHALALSAAMSKQQEDDDDFELDRPAPIPAPADTPAPVAAAAPPPDPPAPEPAPTPTPTPSAAASSSSSASSLPPLKPAGGNLGGKSLDLPGLGVDAMAKMDKRAEKQKRDKEQELLTKKIEALSREAPPSAMTPAELADREKHLKAQRQRLLDAKKKEREEGLKSFTAQTATLEKKGSMHAKVASEVLAAVAAAEKSLGSAKPPAPAAGGGGGGEEVSEEERKRLEMRKALAKRLKDEVTG